MLDGNTAEFAVALRRMAIAEIEETTLGVDRQINHRADADIGQVHVAAVVVRDQRGDRLDLRRGADGADERLVRQRDLVVPLGAGLGIDMQLLDPLRQRLMQQRGLVGADKAAEARHHHRGTARLRPARHDALDIDGERIALLGTVDPDRPVLRIEIGKVEDLRGAVGLVLDRALERIVGLGRDHGTGIDGQHRLDVGAVDIVVLALLGFGNGMLGAGLALGDALVRHDRVVIPGH